MNLAQQHNLKGFLAHFALTAETLKLKSTIGSNQVQYTNVYNKNNNNNNICQETDALLLHLHPQKHMLKSRSIDFYLFIIIFLNRVNHLRLMFCLLCLLASWLSLVIKTSVWASLGQTESRWVPVKHREDFLLSLSQAAKLNRVIGAIERREGENSAAVTLLEEYLTRSRAGGNKEGISMRRVQIGFI